jgi:hypothetical protein
MRALSIFALVLSTASAEVSLIRTPDGGIQPQAAVDQSGRIHLVYLKGAPRGGDLFYLQKTKDAAEFSKPLRVNSNSGSAIAVGTIRGAQIALGKNGRIHVAWNSADGKEMLYTRLNNAGDAFESERNVMIWTGGLDGGGSVAADEMGNVYVSWHGSAPDNKQGEAGRAVFVAKSQDEGKTFAKELQANPMPTGVCGCCGMKALAAGNKLYLLYRAATKVIGRDMTLLISDGKEFKQRVVSKWNLGSCPMSSAALLKSQDGVLAAWEMERQIAFLEGEDMITPPGNGKRKHPSLAENSSGTILLAWAENTGWERGGSLAWQLFKDKRPIAEIQRAEGIPVWSMPAAVAVGEQFYIIY